MNKQIVRQVVLDTETTGMNKFGVHYKNHKIIEIGAIEIINRRITNNKFHVYLNPKRSVDLEAFRIHGISDEFLLDKPFFSDIIDEFLKFIHGSELIMHNASFDLGFLNYELRHVRSGFKNIESFCTIVDSLKIARQMFPGQRNSLDALCDRYSINNNNRVFHNALIDAEILANVFLLMTGGQIKLDFVETKGISQNVFKILKNEKKELIFNCIDSMDSRKNKYKKSLTVIYADEQEVLEHEKYLDFIEKRLNTCCCWRRNS